MCTRDSGTLIGDINEINLAWVGTGQKERTAKSQNLVVEKIEKISSPSGVIVVDVFEIASFDSQPPPHNGLAKVS